MIKVVVEYLKRLIDKNTTERLNAFIALMCSCVLAFGTLYLIILIPFVEKSLSTELGILVVPLASLAGYCYRKAKELENKI